MKRNASQQSATALLSHGMITQSCETWRSKALTSRVLFKRATAPAVCLHGCVPILQASQLLLLLLQPWPVSRLACCSTSSLAA
jgi:hypothetical protein